MLVIPLLFSKKIQKHCHRCYHLYNRDTPSAYKLDKSPIELILKIPKIGAPFPKGFFTETTVKVVGPTGQYIITVAFMGMATVGCYLAQNAKELWMRFLPALALIPF